jgi:hypothetical protein
VQVEKNGVNNYITDTDCTTALPFVCKKYEKGQVLHTHTHAHEHKHTRIHTCTHIHSLLCARALSLFLSLYTYNLDILILFSMILYNKFGKILPIFSQNDI